MLFSSICFSNCCAKHKKLSSVLSIEKLSRPPQRFGILVKLLGITFHKFSVCWNLPSS